MLNMVSSRVRGATAGSKQPTRSWLVLNDFSLTRIAKLGATAVAISAAKSGSELPFSFNCGGMIEPAFRPNRPRPNAGGGAAAPPPAEICKAPARSRDDSR